MNKIAKTLATVALLAGVAACTGVDEKARADAAQALTTAQQAAAAAQQAAAAAQAAADKVERLYNKHLHK
jgi:membrane protease subunit (stomatin/prohibitin family)